MVRPSATHPLILLSVVGLATNASAEPQAVTEAPPTDTCPYFPGFWYGGNGGYCLDRDKNDNGYLEVSSHTATIGAVLTATQWVWRHYYPDWVREEQNWNSCSYYVDCHPLGGFYVRRADAATSGPGTEARADVRLEYLPPRTQDNVGGWDVIRWAPNPNLVEGYRRRFRVVSAGPDDLNRWLVLTAHSEAEDYFAVIGEPPRADVDLSVEPTLVEVVKVGGPVEVEIPEGGRAVGSDVALPAAALIVPLFGKATARVQARATDPMTGEPVRDQPMVVRLLHDLDLNLSAGIATTKDGERILERELRTDASGNFSFYVGVEDLFDAGALDVEERTGPELIAELDGMFAEPIRLDVRLRGAGDADATVKAIHVVNNLGRIARAYTADTHHIPLRDLFGQFGAADESLIVCHEYQELTLIYLNLMRHDLLKAWTFAASPPVEYLATDWLFAGIDYTPTQWQFGFFDRYEHQQVAVYPAGRASFGPSDLALIFDPYFRGRPEVLSLREEDATVTGSVQIVVSTLPPPTSPDYPKGHTLAQGSCYQVPDAPYPAVTPGATYFDSPFSTGCRTAFQETPAKLLSVKHPALEPGVSLTAGGVFQEAFVGRLFDDFAPDLRYGQLDGDRVVADLGVSVAKHLFPVTSPIQADAVDTGDRIELHRRLVFDSVAFAALPTGPGDRIPTFLRSIERGGRIIILSPVAPLFEWPGGEKWGFEWNGESFDARTNPDKRPITANPFAESGGGYGLDILNRALDFQMTLTGYEDGVFTLVVHQPDLQAPQPSSTRVVFRDVPVTVGEQLVATFDSGAPVLTRSRTGEVILPEDEAPPAPPPDGGVGPDGGTSAEDGGAGDGGAAAGCGCRATPQGRGTARSPAAPGHPTAWRSASDPGWGPSLLLWVSLASAVLALSRGSGRGSARLPSRRRRVAPSPSEPGAGAGSARGSAPRRRRRGRSRRG